MDPERTTAKTEPLTIKEIARLTGVSIGTVDRVLHNRGRVAPENVAKIQTLIEERGYRPNVLASRLSGKQVTRSIAVVMPDAEQDRGYWGLLRQGVERAASELEPLRIEIVVETFDRLKPEAAAKALQRAVAADCGALALAPIHARILRPLVEKLPTDLVVAFFDTDMDCSREHCFIGQDPFQGGKVASRLLDLSVPADRPLGLVQFDEDDEHLEARSRGFEEGCAQWGRRVERLTQSLSAAEAARVQEAEVFARAHPELGGWFVPNALAGDYAGLSERGRLVGYDLTSVNRKALEEGRLTALLSQRPSFMGYEAVRRLGRALVFQEALPARVGIPLDVIFRENLAGHEDVPLG